MVYQRIDTLQVTGESIHCRTHQVEKRMRCISDVSRTSDRLHSGSLASDGHGGGEH